MTTDRHGIPLAFPLTGANVHDSVPFEELLDAVPPVAGGAAPISTGHEA
jgi:hypothetical protein